MLFVSARPGSTFVNYLPFSSVFKAALLKFFATTRWHNYCRKYKSSVQNIFDKMSNYEMYQRFLYHTNSINTQNQGGIYCVAVQVSCGREICFGRPITRGGSSDFSRQSCQLMISSCPDGNVGSFGKLVKARWGVGSGRPLRPQFTH